MIITISLLVPLLMFYFFYDKYLIFERNLFSMTQKTQSPADAEGGGLKEKGLYHKKLKVTAGIFAKQKIL